MSQSYNFESYPPLFRPSPNISQIEESDETESSLLLDSCIPVIDYFKRTAPIITTTKYQDVSEDGNLISEACRDWGLFRLVNHGIPFSLLNQIEEHAKKLFSLPYETKKAFFASSSSSNFVSPISYFWGSPALSPSGAALAPKNSEQQNNNQTLQWMEGFNVSLAQLSNIHYQDILLETFRCLLEEYGKELCRLATEIFKILGPFESNYMSLDTGLLRVYRYPRCLEPERTWGIDTHTDSSVLSIIHQDDVGGLQVYKDHQWIDVNPLPNTLIVNIGDMLQAMSDDRYMSVKHRVKVNRHKERISIGYFVFPDEDTIIRSTKYNPFSYADFRAQVQHDLKTIGLKTDKYYVVDAGLRNTRGFLAPFEGMRYHLQDYRGSEREPKNGKELFNYRHASLRNVIERTFDAWKSRFTILRQGMNNYECDMQVKIVIACAVLHNFLREHQSSDGIFNEYENDDMIVDESDELLAQGNNIASSSRSSDSEMQAHREEIVHKM